MEQCMKAGLLTGQMDIARRTHGKHKWLSPNKHKKWGKPLLWFPRALKKIRTYRTSRSRPICLLITGMHFFDMRTVIIMRMSGYMRTILTISENPWPHARSEEHTSELQSL